MYIIPCSKQYLLNKDVRRLVEINDRLSLGLRFDSLY